MYYTWMDIEWKIKSERSEWPSFWDSIDVYADELIIYYHEPATELRSSVESLIRGSSPETSEFKNSIESSLSWLEKVFDGSFDVKDKTIKLQLTDGRLQVVFEEISAGATSARNPLPLFKNSVYRERGKLDEPLKLFKIPVIAFHSYKGGVGRTLSLIALLRELSKNKGFKALVVDADVEAPGLTLMTKNHGFPSEQRISYADILSIIHDSETVTLFNETLNDIAKSMVNSIITVPGTDIDMEHFFLPAYRFDYQLLDSFIHPETIVSMPDRTFVIQEFLSKLGEVLKVDAIIIDLRAGLSELSAPFLFDPRVKRIFVTTTSKQSVEGTKFILENIFASSFPQKYAVENDNEIVNMTILLTMIPKDFDNNKRDKIVFDLLDIILKNASLNESEENNDDDDKVLSDIIIESKFSDSLIHLEDLEQIIESLKRASVAEAYEILSKRLINISESHESRPQNIGDPYRREIIEKIHDIASKEVTAEGTAGGVQLMATGSLERLARTYEDIIPRAVILGAKGSGKTYIYKQLLDNACWESFTTKILSKEEPKDQKSMIVPVLATANRKEMTVLLDRCFSAINGVMHISADMLNKNEVFLAQKNEDANINPTEWLKIWNEIFLNSISQGNEYHSLAELDNKLSAMGKRLVFIIDGLEDVFTQTISSKNSQMAIKYLCQDIIKDISMYKNIGIIIFIRNDIIKNSIQVNYEQFVSQYADYALKWTQDEALRLVVWILAQVKFKDYQKDNEKIPKFTHDKLVDNLYPFWGRKLGKDGSNEAFSSRWILAALSDLNLQIQARDIIRFLEAVTTNYTDKDMYYHDRILLPGDIKRAIIPCSQKKLEEITMEMQDLKPIFANLKNPGSEKKKELPIKVDEMILSSTERSLLEVRGYLQLAENAYYIPEIIRHALGYKYHHGSRPRVLSLSPKQ